MLALRLRTLNKTKKPQAQLQRWILVVDGNAHREDLVSKHIGFQKTGMISESMLPDIRRIACQIAALRHDFTTTSPSVFTEEADWFAARILVLGTAIFHLDVALSPLVKEANLRASTFARLHGLAFKPAKVKLSLHANRPHNMLIVEIPESLPTQDLGIVKNSLFLKNRLCVGI